MKQIAVLVMMLIGGAAASLIHPFYGILPYYILSVLRPQSIWDYALPEGVRWSLMAAAIAILAVALHAKRLFATMRWNPVSTLLAILGALLLVSCLAARDTDVAAGYGVEYFKIFFMAMLATVVIQKQLHVRWLMLMIFACIGYIAWEFNARYLFENRLDILTDGHDGLDNNDTGLMLAMGIPLAYGWWQAKRGWVQFLSAAVAGAVIIHSLMLSYSRSGMVAAVVAVGWLALHHQPRRQLLFLVPVVVAGVLYMAGPEIRAEFMSVKEYEQDTTAQLRFDNWQRGWATAWDHAFTGAGVRNSNLMSEAYGAYTNGRSIHNTYLQIAADSGIPAMFIYIAAIVTAVLLLRAFRRRLTGEKRLRGEPYRRRRSKPRPTLDPRQREAYAMALALEGSIIAFATGAVFLSLEFFELPWLMLVMAGALPKIALPQTDSPRRAARGAETDSAAKPPTHTDPLDAFQPGLMNRPIIHGGPTS